MQHFGFDRHFLLKVNLNELRDVCLDMKYVISLLKYLGVLRYEKNNLLHKIIAQLKKYFYSALFIIHIIKICAMKCMSPNKLDIMLYVIFDNSIECFIATKGRSLWPDSTISHRIL